jgi:hypothetical protein
VQKQRVWKHLGEITALCKTTNLFDANIGLKYLQVMQKVFAFTPKQWRIKHKEVKQYAIVADVAHTIIMRLKEKIKGNSQSLNDNEKQLIQTLVGMYTCLIYQLHFVDYFWTAKKTSKQETYAERIK